MAIGEIILHVGMHKTGTSSIQRTFADYDDGQIAYADLQIPRNLTPNHGVAIETIFRTDPVNTPHHVRHDRSAKVVAGYQRQFRAKLAEQLARNRDRLIISGEAIPRLSQADLTPLRDQLMAAADKVTVLAYIREPVGFSASMFQQRCKAATFAAAGHIPAPQYRRKFKKFLRLFGRENVVFAPYDRAKMIGNSSVDDFAHRVGITDIPKVCIANVGLSDDATRCLYILGMQPDLDFTRLENKMTLTRFLHPLRDALPGPSFKLPSQAVAARVKSQDLDWINRVAGFDISISVSGHFDAADLDAQLRTLSASS